MAVRVSVFLWVYVSVSVCVWGPVYWLPAVDLSAAITVDLECFFAIFPLVIVVLALVVVVAVGTYSHVQLIAFNLLDFISVFRRLLCFLPFCCPCPAAPAACLSAISYSLSLDRFFLLLDMILVLILISRDTSACNCNLSVQFDLIFGSLGSVLPSPCGMSS